VRPKQSSTRTKKSAARKDKPAAPLDWSKVPEELKMLMQIELDRITDDMLCVAVKPGAKIRLGQIHAPDIPAVIGCSFRPSGLNETQR
jgi:hypothetical protein